MHALPSLLASSLALAVAACGGAPGPKPTDPRDVQGPGDLGGRTVSMPHSPGVAYVDLSCTSPEESCNYPPPFELHVVGDKVKDCRANPSAGTLAVHLTNMTDPTVNIVLSRDQGFHGQGRYSLDAPVGRAISVAIGTNLASWNGRDGSCATGSYSGAPHPATTGVAAPDTCGSGDACHLQVDDPDPSAPFPKRLGFSVECSSMCINGSQPSAGAAGTVCKQHGNQPVIAFDFTATCS